MRKWIFFVGVMISFQLWAAVGYLGRYPYTKTVAKLRADFNVPPPAPAPERRAQYAYMAVPLDIAPSDTIPSEPVGNSNKDPAPLDFSSDEPTLGDDTKSTETKTSDENQVDWDSL